MIININKYGGKGIFGGKEQPINYDIAYCEKCDECSFYKNKTCFNAGRWTQDCKIGKKENDMGYTSRSKNYYEFNRKYNNEKCLHFLKEPKKILGNCGNLFILNLELIKLNENGILENYVHFDKSPLIFIEKEKFTNDFIKKICDQRPRTMMGDGFISRYYEEIVPKFLINLKKDYNNLYNSFINEFPEYENKINYIGKKVLVKSLDNGFIIKNNKEIFLKEGNKLICEDYYSCFLPFGAKKSKLIIDIDDKMTYEVKKEDVVSENWELEN